MPTKIKLFLSFLGLIAVTLVFLGFKNLQIDLGKKFADINISTLPEPDADWDDDGLSNKEESYWNTDPNNPDTDGDGYLDGEEVVSGHDPRIPGPDDLLRTSNLTDSLAGLVATGIYTGEFNNNDNSKLNRTVEDLSLSVVYDFYENMEAPKNFELSIIPDNKSNQAEYLNNISEIITNDLLNFPRKLNTGKLIFEQSEFFSAKSSKYQLAYEKIRNTPVPENWEVHHKQILVILHRLRVNYADISSSDIDPLRAVLALNEVGNINTEIKELLNQITQKVKNEGLTLDNTLYQTLMAIY